MRARYLPGILGALIVAVCVAAPAHATPDPYQIFGDARAYWQQQKYPMLLDYNVAVEVVEGGKERVEHYKTEYDALAGVVHVDPISDYQREHPVVVKGINIGILGIALNKPLPPVDWLGVPLLAPTYSFGMAPFVPAPTPTPFNSAALVAEIRKEFHDPNPRATPTATPTPNTLEEIATVYAHNRDYTISLLGTDTIDGHACFHLGLTPTRDPGRFRIRQAWIDEQTFATWQLQDASNFSKGPGTDIGWIIHFTQIDGAQYIREEDALASMSTGGEIYTQTSVRFENVVAASAPSLREELAQDGLVQGGVILDEPSPEPPAQLQGKTP
jgi:hypothetical protein